ncbi:MAG: hypothetical protein PWQ77_1903, partial [Kosmotogales bacterium]|nr:hypothetical protein [Kosmotogales bacterium]
GYSLTILIMALSIDSNSSVSFPIAILATELWFFLWWVIPPLNIPYLFWTYQSFNCRSFCTLDPEPFTLTQFTLYPAPFTLLLCYLMMTFFVLCFPLSVLIFHPQYSYTFLFCTLRTHFFHVIGNISFLLSLIGNFEILQITIIHI